MEGSLDLSEGILLFSPEYPHRHESVGCLFLFLQFFIVGLDEMPTTGLEGGEFGMSFLVLARYTFRLLSLC